jgi:hypothetical protein
MIPYIDRGDPIHWPLYSWRVSLVKRYPALYSIVWFDFRN